MGMGGWRSNKWLGRCCRPTRLKKKGGLEVAPEGMLGKRNLSEGVIIFPIVRISTKGGRKEKKIQEGKECTQDGSGFSYSKPTERWLIPREGEEEEKKSMKEKRRKKKPIKVGGEKQKKGEEK